MVTIAPPPTQTPRNIQSGVRLRRWNRAEYYRMAEIGVLRPDEAVELINGEVIAKVSPIGPPHRVTVYLASRYLERMFGEDYYTDAQSSLILDDLSEPQPDILVARGGVQNYIDQHPLASQACLVIEVSDSTLPYDRSVKSLLYSQAGIPEYWILNLGARQLEVYRSPNAVTGYASMTVFTEADTITPLEPPIEIAISKLFPPKKA